VKINNKPRPLSNPTYLKLKDGKLIPQRPVTSGMESYVTLMKRSLKKIFYRTSSQSSASWKPNNVRNAERETNGWTATPGDLSLKVRVFPTEWNLLERLSEYPCTFSWCYNARNASDWDILLASVKEESAALSAHKMPTEVARAREERGVESVETAATQPWKKINATNGKEKRKSRGEWRLKICLTLKWSQVRREASNWHQMSRYQVTKEGMRNSQPHLKNPTRKANIGTAEIEWKRSGTRYTHRERQLLFRPFTRYFRSRCYEILYLLGYRPSV